MNYEQISEQLTSSITPKYRAWLFGNLVWVFGVIDRSIAALTDASLSLGDIGQLAMVSFFWLGWLYLKPKPKSDNKAIARTGFAQVLLQSTREVISEN
ncbi:hypothetical protein ACN4EK_06200 [Pantanalinema rosaneae CENA516]|uniref:hypothetical protein n=1 Tax=Pantanalinema rosaneae TaxID=1620701 RepID=UPI003D6F3E05